MVEQTSPGNRLKAALEGERPLQVVGAINAYAARLAERAGFKAIYLSGGGVSAASLGVPDLGITMLEDVLIDVRRITDTTSLPLLVDVDTGFGTAFNIARTVRSLIKMGAAAMHIEDQVLAKRCGHRPGKALVSQAEMVDRIKAAVDARTDPSFGIMARTDALAVEGFPAALERAQAYVQAGADMLFPEAVADTTQFTRFAQAVDVPILANMTEFGKTPLRDVQELAELNIDIILYPLTAFRVMSAAALQAYETIRHEGSQKSLLPLMQTRTELYEVLDYFTYEQKLDELFTKEENYE
jgi:methylisocitrate lyase